VDAMDRLVNPPSDPPQSLLHQLNCFGNPKKRHPMKQFTKDPQNSARFMCPVCGCVMRIVVDVWPDTTRY